MPVPRPAGAGDEVGPSLDRLDKFVQWNHLYLVSISSETQSRVGVQTDHDLVKVLRAMKGLTPAEVIEHIRTALNKAMPSTLKSPLADALFRGIEAQRQIKESDGGTLSVEEAARALSLGSKQAVIDRYNKHRLLGWREKQGAIRFPLWQFQPGKGVLKGLPEVLEVLAQGRNLDDWGKVLFFVNPRESLRGRRPLDLLKKGIVQPIVDLAKTYAE